jgi:hypothetical protein
MIKSKGDFYYKKKGKNPFDKCSCGNFKQKASKKCYKCLGMKKDGTFRRKKDYEKRVKTNGYIFIYKPKHHKSNSIGYVAEHIFLMEKHLKRKLKKGEVVHHKNKKRDDNRIENLEVMTTSNHSHLHNPNYCNPLRYGKYKSHTRNYCKCGNLKDVRSKKCKKCYNKRFHTQ